MSGWLRNLQNIQGQLSELASEVLNEATQEVEDPESELQVSRKKCTELEDQLKAEQTKIEVLENKLKESEERLYSTHVELDQVNNRYTSMISARDDQIKRMQIELEQLRVSSNGDVDEDTFDAQIADLRKEIAHWKALVKNDKPSPSSSDVAKELKKKHTEEIAALVEMHDEKMRELREEYEERIASIHAHQGGAASSSESSGDVLDAVLLEKEELLEEKRRLEEELALRRKQSEADRPVMVDIQTDDEKSLNELEQRIITFKEEIRQLKEKDQLYEAKDNEIERLRVENDELTMAYNELNKELEDYKARHSTVSTNNRDLNNRIDALKANLIEYEERYEICKRENAETVKQLEKLSTDFERLRTGLAETKSRAESTDASLSGEVDKLRDALERSKEDRDKLRSDVDRFRSAISAIDSELNTLRDANRRLADENVSLTSQLDNYDSSVKNALQRNESDLKGFREEFENLQRLSNEKEERYSELSKRQNEQIETLESTVNRLREENDRLRKAQVEGTPASSSNDEQREWDEKERHDMVASLTEQLREALQTNTETTEECERLRRDKEELDKEVVMRQTCIDEMIAQTSVLQMQQQQAAVANQHLKQQIAEKEKQLLKMELQLAHEKEKTEELTKSAAEAAPASAEGNAELQSQLAARVSEIAGLQTVLQQKHAESLDYYNRLTALIEEMNAVQAARTEMEGRVATTEAALAGERERNDKASRELSRLKEHLMMVEETSTREAIEREKRETELLSKIRVLEEASHAVNESAVETTSTSLARIAALEQSLAAAEADAEGSRKKLRRVEEEKEEVTGVVTKLQMLVRELASDNERDNATASHKSLEQQHQIQELTQRVTDLSTEIERITLDKQAAEDAAEAAKEAERAKERVIEELENRLEESSRPVQPEQPSQYRIDDATLRQLFLSYFTAPADKRADIAILLASILEYPPDEMDKVRAAVKGSHGQTSHPVSLPSLADQFVRFLERESESARTAPHLPIRSERSAMQADEPASHSMPSSESAAALREMLQNADPAGPSTSS